HQAQFGFIDRNKELVIEAVTVEAVGGRTKFKDQPRSRRRGALPSPRRRTRFYSNAKWRRAAVFTRDQLACGHKIPGPAILIEPHQTIVVEHGWRAEVTRADDIVLRRIVPIKRRHAI